MKLRLAAPEWPTLLLLSALYPLWFGALYLPVGLAIPVVALLAALHSSLSHEALHGHPTRWAALNAALVFPALSLFVPYLRFKDTHLAHHCDSRLTDPYDDPESNYLDPVVWAALPSWRRAVLAMHNTLAGRMVLGPVVGQLCFMRGDCAQIWQGDRRIALAWLLHIPAVAIVFAAVWLAPLPVWAYLLAAYLANAILRIRTFLEHQAHTHSRCRSVIIEDRGLLAFLFLNNSLHVVHHMHPRVPWYQLPSLYAHNKARYLARNAGYRYGSYGEVFRRYFLKRKDPVAHPLYQDWRSER